MLIVLVIAAVVLGSTGWGAASSGGQITSLGTGEHLPWRAWLLVDPNGDGQSTSSSPSSDREEEGRRITPKSLFIAPAFSGGGSRYELPECAEGYRADKLGRCVKLVRVNQAAQRDFLLSKLSAIYAGPAIQGAQTASQSAPTGPLQVSLPVAAPETESAVEEDDSKDSSVEVAVVMADVLQESSEKESPPQNKQTILALWNIASNGTLADKETSEIQPGEGQLPQTSSSTTTTTMTTNMPHQLPNDDRQLLLTAPTAILTLKNGGTSRRNASSPFESAGQMMDEAMSFLSNSASVTESSHKGEMPDNEPANDFIAETIAHTNYSEVKSDLKLNSTNDAETNLVDVQNASNANASEIVNNSSRTSVNNNANISEREKRPNSFVRFPSESNILDPLYMHAKTSSSSSSSSSSSTMVRFPDSSRSSSSVVFPRDQSSIGHTETFWWLPPGWRLDETRHKPMLLRFWARVPLLRDQVTDSLPLHHPQVLDEAEQRQERMLDMHSEANANLQRPTRS